MSILSTHNMDLPVCNKEASCICSSYHSIRVGLQEEKGNMVTNKHTPATSKLSASQCTVLCKPVVYDWKE